MRPAFIGAMVAAMLLAACGAAGASPADTNKSVNVSGKQDITIEMYENYFDPAVLVGTSGQALTVHLSNAGKMAHTFTIDGQVDRELAPGAKADVQITFPASGNSSFYCRFHRAMGMTGTLKIQVAPY